MSPVCGACGVSQNEDDSIKCSKCGGEYHLTCVGLTQDVYRKMTYSARDSWKCCKPKRGVEPKEKSITELMNTLKDELIASQKISHDTLLGRLDKQTALMGNILKENEELKKSLVFLSERYDELHKKLTICESAVKNVDQLTQRNKSMERRMEYLEEKLDRAEQQMNIAKIEVKGIPFERGENLKEMIVKLGEAVGVGTDEGTITEVKRFFNKKIDEEISVKSSSLNFNGQGYVAVTFDSRDRRDCFLTAVKMYNKNKKNKEDKLNTRDLGMKGNHPVYVQENLTPRQHHLHMDARKFAKINGYKFVCCWLELVRVDGVALEWTGGSSCEWLYVWMDVCN